MLLVCQILYQLGACETILYTTIIPLPVCLLGRVLVVESRPMRK